MKRSGAAADAEIRESSQPLRSCEYKEFRDSVALYKAYSQIAQCKNFASLVPDNRCLHQTGYLDVNGMPLMASVATPFFTWPDSGSDLHLIALMQGSVLLRNREDNAQLSSGGILIASVLGHELRVDGGRCGIRLQRSAIATAAAAMAGPASGVVRRRLRRFEYIRPIDLQFGTAQATAMHSLIRHIDDCFSAGPLVAARLGLDDVVHRLVASLLAPELLSDEPTDLLRYREKAGGDAFDDLIDYIKANLNQPLKMSDLESRSHYSRRSLQYAFQERMGCSPKQWIREQRLTLALAQLQTEGKRPLIRQVALACGYQDLSHFCADFKRRYGITPLQASRR